MEILICSKCKKAKPISEFDRRLEIPRGRISWCKECRKKWRQENKEIIIKRRQKYCQKNRKKINEKSKLYRIGHRKQLNEYKKEWDKLHPNAWKEFYWSHKEYREKKKKQAREWTRVEFKKNPKFRIDKGMGRSIYVALKERKAGRKWETLVGYTLKDLLEHLERQFEPWMSWQNYGKWEIDHIKPKSLFKYETAEDPEFKKCWGLNNLRPLEKEENRRKWKHYSCF